MVHSVFLRLPDLNSNGGSVWLSDFLIGTAAFNYLTLLEYALVNYAMALDAKREAREKKERTGDLVSPAEVKVTPASHPPLPGAPRSARRLQARLQTKLESTIIKAKNMDATCRWLFPPVFVLYLIVMFSMLNLESVYPSNAPCFEPSA